MSIVDVNGLWIENKTVQTKKINKSSNNKKNNHLPTSVMQEKDTVSNSFFYISVAVTAIVL